MQLAIVLLAAYLSSAGARWQSPPPSPAPEAKKTPYRDRLAEQARQGDRDAQFELGKNYETGRIGLPKDLSKAQYWYEQAAAQGDPYAEASLGILFNFGKGVERDYFRACVWYERAISHSSPADRQDIVELRDHAAENLTPAQIEQARTEAHKWKPAPAKKQS
jgi:TPR repeat protein